MLSGLEVLSFPTESAEYKTYLSHPGVLRLGVCHRCCARIHGVALTATRVCLDASPWSLARPVEHVWVYLLIAFVPLVHRTHATSHSCRLHVVRPCPSDALAQFHSPQYYVFGPDWSTVVRSSVDAIVTRIDTDTASRRTWEVRCDEGHYCIAGERFPCPPGRFGDERVCMALACVKHARSAIVWYTRVRKKDIRGLAFCSAVLDTGWSAYARKGMSNRTGELTPLSFPSLPPCTTQYRRQFRNAFLVHAGLDELKLLGKLPARLLLPPGRDASCGAPLRRHERVLPRGVLCTDAGYPWLLHDGVFDAGYAREACAILLVVSSHLLGMHDLHCIRLYRRP